MGNRPCDVDDGSLLRSLLWPLILALLLRSAVAGSDFQLGYNHPWAGYGHDFGANAWGHDGVITSGWSYQTAADTQGFTDARRVEKSNCSGRAALRITADLKGGTPNRKSGEIELTLSNHPPRQGSLPAPVQYLNLEGVMVRVRVWLPEGSAGARDAPNGVQLVFKTRLSDTDWPSFYSEWRNIEPAEGGYCIEVSARVSSSGPGLRFGAFDAKKVSLIGLKLGINSASSAEIKGFIDLESYTIDTTPSVKYDFEKPEFERDFEAARLLSGGQLSIARVFVFADGPAAPDFAQDGTPMDLSKEKYFFEDFDELLRIVERQGIQVMPVLLDFWWCGRARWVSGVQLGGHADIISNETKRQAFLDNVLKPLLLRYGTSPWIHSWDIINEPEWCLAELSDATQKDFELVTTSQMQGFVWLCAQYVHRYTRHSATVGSARRKWLPNWRGLGLDFYQFHWYDHFAPEEPFPFPPADALKLDKPILIGEVPTARAKTKQTAGEFLEAARGGGYGGLLLWSLRAGDEYSDFAAATGDLQSRSPRVTAEGVLNAASFLTGRPVAPDSWVSLFGQNLARRLAKAEGAPFPTTLDGVTVKIAGAAGAEQLAPLLFVSPGQINFLMPAGANLGTATLSVNRLDGGAGVTKVQIDPVAPGVFSANADGKGVAAAVALRVGADGAQTTVPVFRCDAAAGGCVAVPIDLGPGTDQVVLLLFGTGLRRFSSLSAVSVRIGGQDAQVLAAAAQGQFLGLDQVNVLLPRSLIGRGEVDVVLTVDGNTANTIRINVR